MFSEFINNYVKVAGEKSPFAVAMVVNRVVPSSGKPGDKAIILPDGTMKGWVGGGCTRGIVLKEALLAIEQGKPRLVSISPGSDEVVKHGVVAYNMTCQSGGSVFIYIEPVLPQPKVVIMGKSQIAQALCKIAKATGYEVAVAASGIDVVGFSNADQVHDGVNPPDGMIQKNAYVVVCTQGEHDVDTLHAAIQSEADYVSFVSSYRKANAVFNELKKLGVSIDALKRIKTPAGIDIKAKLPEEVAISIIAEIIQHFRSGAGDKTKIPPLNLDEYFINPVCQVPIQKSTAKHIIPHQGKDYFFCCDGCKDVFVENPSKYAVKE